MRLTFTHERHRRIRETQEVAEEIQNAGIPLRAAVLHYSVAAALVVGAAPWLPRLGAELARLLKRVCGSQLPGLQINIAPSEAQHFALSKT